MMHNTWVSKDRLKVGFQREQNSKATSIDFRTVLISVLLSRKDLVLGNIGCKQAFEKGAWLCTHNAVTLKCS